MLNLGQGGAIPEFDDGGTAPPPDPQTPDMDSGGFGGGDTTPQPPAPDNQPQWGQSLGQDASNVGAAASAIPGQLAQNVQQGPAAQAGNAMSQKVQGLKDYISGKGAVPKDQFEQLGQEVDPRNTMDPNERNMRILDAAANNPTKGAAAIQTMRQHWDVYRGSAAKMITEGNAAGAASEISKGFQYVPDSSKTMVTPNKDGFTFTTHTMDGQDTTNYMDSDQTKQFLTGAHGLFDNVVGKGTGTVLSSLSPPAASSGANPPAPGGGGASPESGGPPPNSFANTQVGPSDKAAAENRAYQSPEDLKKIGGMAPWRRKPTFTNPDDAKEGDNDGPVYVTRGGVTTTEGNASKAAMDDPGGAQAAREANPNNPAGQIGFAEKQQSTRQEQASKLDIAKNTRVMGSQATAAGRNVDSANRAGATIQSALIKAQSVTDGTDKRFEGEQGRDAANILKQMMHDNPGAPIGDQIKALRDGNISDKLINHLVNPQAQAPAEQPQQRQRPSQAPATAQQPQQGRRLGGAQAAPPAAPAAATTAPKMAPPPAAIQMLKEHPETAHYFDAQFGDGSSKQYLGQ